jgi:hypothetical protein
MKATLLIVMLVLTACGKKSDEPAGPDPEVKRMAGLCVDATELAKSRTLKDDTLREVIGNQLTACSRACDGGDKPSCTALEARIETLCKVSAGACSAMCDPEKPGSITSMSCPRVKK